MISNNIWIVFNKSTPMDGCRIDMDGCEFYFSEAFVPVYHDEENTMVSIDEIIMRVKNKLLEDNLALSDVSKCLIYKKDEWLFDTAMNQVIHDLSQKSLSSGKVELSGFRSEEIEEICCYNHSVDELAC